MTDHHSRLRAERARRELAAHGAGANADAAFARACHKLGLSIDIAVIAPIASIAAAEAVAANREGITVSE